MKEKEHEIKNESQQNNNEKMLQLVEREFKHLNLEEQYGVKREILEEWQEKPIQTIPMDQTKLSENKIKLLIQYVKGFHKDLMRVLLKRTRTTDGDIMTIVTKFDEAGILTEALATTVFHDHQGYYRGTQEKAPEYMIIAVKGEYIQFLHFILKAGAGKHIKRCNALGDNAFHNAAWKGNEIIFKMILNSAKNPKVDMNVINESGYTPLDLACRYKNYRLIDAMLATKLIQTKPLLQNIIKKTLKEPKLDFTLGYCLKYYENEVFDILNNVEEMPRWASYLIYGFKTLKKNREQTLLEQYNKINGKE